MIAGQPFPHLLYHFVLTYSNWECGIDLPERELRVPERRRAERAVAPGWRTARASHRQPLGGHP